MKLPSRASTVKITIGFCYLAIVSRLFYIQILKFPILRQQISSQNYKTSVIKPQMGSILSSDNFPLLFYQTFYKVSLYKPDFKIPLDQIKISLSTANPNILKTDSDKIDSFITNDKLKWLTLSSLFSAIQIKSINDPGFNLETIQIPFYPEASLGINYLNRNGLPSYYQRQLNGKSGFSWETKDAVGNIVLTHPGWIIDPQDGQNIKTYINRQAQQLSESILSKGITNFSADSGEILIMDSKTGGIIAMTAQIASESAIATPSATQNNPIISNLFEPGSIVKPLVMSAALDSKSIKSDYLCSKCDRPIQIGQYAISNWDNSFHPNSNLRDIIKNSDNIGMSYIVREMGYDKFIKYFNLLGFNHKTSIDLPGEARPLTKNYWPEIDLATASFGQGFAITQIQMLTAFNSLANNGYKVEPHFVQNQNIQTSQIFKSTTINEIKNILKYSVENGAVAKLKPINLEVCGKSGTSQVAVAGGYSESSTIASYIGFSPCNDPQFTMIVTIHNPRTSPWGSSTAAPLWYEIAAKLPSLL